MEKSKKTPSLLFFDLDGTLLDTSADIRACLSQALVSNGFELSNPSLDSLKIGPPLIVMLQTLYPDALETKLQKVIQSFRMLYDSSDYPLTVAYPGIEDLLPPLLSLSKLYVATNKVYLPTERLIRKFGWESLFVDLLSPDRFGTTLQTKTNLIEQILNNQNVQRENCALIGDHPSDIAVARSTNISSIAVSWGYSSVEQLEEAKPDLLVSSADSLRRWIHSFVMRQNYD